MRLRRPLQNCSRVAALLLALLLVPCARSQSTPAPAPAAQTTPANVTAGGELLFPIAAPLGRLSAADRAAALSRKLARFFAAAQNSPEDITTAEDENATDILAGDEVLLRVTEQDAAAAGPPLRTRQALAAAYVQTMRAAMVSERDQTSARSLTVGAAKAAAASAVLLLLFVLLHFLFPAVYRQVAEHGIARRPLRFQSVELLSQERMTELLLKLAHVARFALSALLLYFFIPLVFSFFPATRHFGFELVSYVLSPIVHGWHAFVAYLPRLLVVVVIAFFASQVLKLSRFVFREIDRGTLQLKGFYPEWALPTQRIVEIFLFAFTLVLAFPYLPGSDSAAFKGVSIFFGVLLSLGSSSAIANVVAGVLLTYTRAFRVGDRVQIDHTVGDVIEKTLLATHVRTIKNVNITIPNGLVLAAHIVNYSRSTPELPLILNTEFTLGYDIPWRRVHELLLAAADSTPGLLKEPAPFVLQTALDDFYVRYQINANSAQPGMMARIYSDLNKHILDSFNEAGIEMLAPHYRVMRANDYTTIPAPYLATDEPQDHARHPHPPVHRE